MPRLESVHPVLMCRDVADSLRFYERLGFASSFQDELAAPKYAVIRRDAVELHLQWADATQWACPHDRPVYRVLVSDPDALYAELSDTDALDRHATGPWRMPSDTSWGTREFHLQDPGGNGLQFYRLL